MTLVQGDDVIQTPVQLSDITLRADRIVAELDQSYCLTWTNQGAAGASVMYRSIGP